MNILRLDKLGLFWLWFYVMVSLFVHSLRDMIRDVYKLCIWYSCIRAFINCILWLLLVLRRRLTVYWSFVTLIVDLINSIIAWIRKTVLKLAMSSTFFTSNNTLSIRACVTSTEIIMYTFQFRKRLWVNMILDSGKSFSISNIKIHILEFSNYQVLLIVEYIWCIHFLLNKCKTSIKTMVLSERFRFVMENKNEIKCRW